MCGLTFDFFKLHVAHTLQNPVLAVLFIACGLHMAEFFFADFPLHVARILQNQYSIIFTLFMVLHRQNPINYKYLRFLPFYQKFDYFRLFSKMQNSVFSWGTKKFCLNFMGYEIFFVF